MTAAVHAHEPYLAAHYDRWHRPLVVVVGVIADTSCRFAGSARPPVAVTVRKTERRAGSKP